MHIAVASDHAGFMLKARAISQLRSLGHDVHDLGVHTDLVPSDYPDAAVAVAKAIAGGLAVRGVLICGSGVGASIAANKIPGTRAAICHDTFSARQGVEDDDMNVLCLGARIIGPELAADVLGAFAGARFSRAERHLRRLEKVIALERELPHTQETYRG